jgi:hypothetical protein
MVIIRFADVEARRRALGYLLGRFSGKSWVTGEVMVSESALPHLAAEGIVFSVEGQATYDRILLLDRQAGVLAAEREAARSV